MSTSVSIITNSVFFTNPSLVSLECGLIFFIIYHKLNSHKNGLWGFMTTLLALVLLGGCWFASESPKTVSSIQKFIIIGTMLTFFGVQHILMMINPYLFTEYEAMSSKKPFSYKGSINSLKNKKGFYITELLFGKPKEVKIKEASATWDYRPVRLAVYLISTINALICAFFGIYYYLIQSYNPQYNDDVDDGTEAGPSPKFSKLLYITSYALGYFLWDLYISFIYWRSDHLMILHAIAGFISYAIFSSGIFTIEGVVFLMYEASTPFLNIKSYLDSFKDAGSSLSKKKENKESSLPVLNLLCFGVVFLHVRIWLGLFFAYNFLKKIFSKWATSGSVVSVAAITLCVIMNGLNLIWSGSILYSAKKKADTLLRFGIGLAVFCILDIIISKALNPVLKAQFQN